MDGEAGWWTTSGNIGLPPLARAMGVGRQQHVINPHIIGITESECEIHIDYTTCRKYWECAKRAGILLYVSINLESNYCSTLNIHKFNAFIWCIVNLFVGVLLSKSIK